MSAAMNPALAADTGSGWRRAAMALGLLWALILWLYRDTGLAMVQVWNRSETFAHAWVVPPIALWLAWRLRRPLLALDPRPAPAALLALLPLGLLWLLGELVVVNPAKQFALVGFLVAAVPAVLGWQVARVLAFPLGFLFFAVPAGEFLTPTLMAWTADFTVGALRLSGIPVYREGLQFIIPSGHWSVVEACSGIRYLISSVMVGTLFAYLNYRSTRRRLLFVGISVVVPIVANWLRAYMIVMLGHLSGNELAVGADHLVYGWVLFGVIIMALYWVGARWAEDMPEPSVQVVSVGAWPGARGAVAVILGGALLVWPLWAWERIDAASQATAPTALIIPASLPGGWRAAEDPVSGWQPHFLAPSATARSGLVSEDGWRAGVYLGYYGQQNADRKLVSSLNSVATPGDQSWIPVGHATRTSPSSDGAVRMRETQVLQAQSGAAASRQRLRVWQTYWVDGRLVAGDAEAKMRGAWGRLMGRGDDSAVILFYVDDVDAHRAESTLARLTATTLPALVGQLERTRAKARGRDDGR